LNGQNVEKVLKKVNENLLQNLHEDPKEAQIINIRQEKADASLTPILLMWRTG
jgi:hypothetical protein